MLDDSFSVIFFGGYRIEMNCLGKQKWETSILASLKWTEQMCAGFKEILEI